MEAMGNALKLFIFSIVCLTLGFFGVVAVFFSVGTEYKCILSLFLISSCEKEVTSIMVLLIASLLGLLIGIILCFASLIAALFCRKKKKKQQILFIKGEEGERLLPIRAEISYEQLLNSKPFVIVKSVEKSGPAHDAGFKPNDRVLQFGTIESETADDTDHIGQMRALIRENLGRPISVEILRGGKHKTLVVVVPLNGTIGCHFASMK